MWTELVGVAPDKGAAFFERLIEKDDGWLASYYDSLARINGPVEVYLTEPERLKRFYLAMRGKVTSPGPATDASGVAHSYLNTEESFRFVKDLESRNLVVPLVGDFAGSKTLRAVGSYLRTQNATVSAFYLSNVEMYLYREMVWDSFCQNVATLPMGDKSVFIRSAFDGRYGRGFGLNEDFGRLLPEVEHCGASKP